jgi:Phage derived protein Gp49-like (DUF891)
VSKRLVHRGERLTIWWGVDHDGRSEGETYYLEEFSDQDRTYVLATFKLVAGVPPYFNETRFRHEGDGVYCFKTRHQHRLAACLVKGGILITHGFKKTGQRMPAREKKKALRLIEEQDDA